MVPSLPPKGVVAVLCVAYFLVIANITLVIPLLPSMTRGLALSAGEERWLLAAFPLVALVTNLTVGPLIDRYGKKTFLRSGAFGAALTFTVTGLSSQADVVLAARAATGLFVPMMGATIFAALADAIPAAERVKYSGYVTATAPLAQLISIPLTLLAGQALSWRVPFLVLGVFSVLVWAAVAFMPETGPKAASAQDNRAPARSSMFLLADPASRHLLAAYFASSFAAFCFLALYPSWLLIHFEAEAGIPIPLAIVFVGGIAGFLGALASARLSALFPSPLTLCGWMAAISSVAVVSVSVGASIMVLQFAAYSVFSFGRAAMLPVVMSSGVSGVPASRRSSMNGLLNATFQSAAAAGSFAGAILFALSPSYFAVGAVAALGFAVSASTFLYGGRIGALARLDRPV